MTRPHKHPEIAQLLRDRYGEKVVEIIGRPESDVAELLKNAKVFVWRGNDKEGSPRPPKEALVAGCVVVGLATDLDAAHCTDFGMRCSSVEELIDAAGQALSLPVPSEAERAVVRDAEEEKQGWIELARQLNATP
jgi:glycosyltransferase involved in cell wall biosynthesis